MTAEPKAYLFDVFGTIVDWRTGVANEVEKLFSDRNVKINPLTFADAWRAKYQPAMEGIRSGNRGYVPLDVLHRENLDNLLEELSLDSEFDNTARNELNKAWEKLPPWPDSVSGLEKLKKKAIIAPCSNGSIALMTRLAKFGGLPWDCILGAEIAGNYKPHPDAYLRSVEVLGLAPGDVVMVAAHNDDLVAARKNGLKTAFITRPAEHGHNQTKDIKPLENWDYIIDIIDDLST